MIDMRTRKYLSLVRETQGQIEMLEKRIALREEIRMDCHELEGELANARDVLKVRKADIADTISRLKGFDVQKVMLLRYVDLKSWERIAEEMERSIRTVHKLHGKGLFQLDERFANTKKEVMPSEVHTSCVSAVRN